MAQIIGELMPLLSHSDSALPVHLWSDPVNRRLEFINRIEFAPFCFPEKRKSDDCTVPILRAPRMYSTLYMNLHEYAQVFTGAVACKRL